LSSILRALKKLENDPRHLDEHQSLENKFVPLADHDQQKKYTGPLIMILGGGLVCGLVILAGWWLLSDKKPPSPGVRQQIASQNQQQTGGTPTVNQEPVIQDKAPLAARQQTAQISSDSATDTPDTQKTAEAVPGATPVMLPQPSTPKIEQKAIMAIASQTDEPGIIVTEKAIPETVGPATALQNETTSETGPFETSEPEIPKKEIPLLEDPQMKLQAITWSKEPLKRIAVINNKILRQGEAVDGYRIDTINQDDVILKERGRRWKLLFRIR